MGHVLGIGTIWTSPLFTGGGTSNPIFSGTAAVGAWSALGGSGAVPVENTGGPGTADGHWREATFDHELMTGWLDTGSTPLSALTVSALGDLGYSVDLAAADSYGLPGLRASAHSDHEASDLATSERLIKPIGTR